MGNNRLALMGGDYDLGSIFAVSSNGGSNWAYEQTGCFGNATGFSFRTPAEVWAALSFSGKFAVNLDSMKPGTTWQCFETPGNVAVNDVVFLSSARGYAFGERGKIFKYNESVIGMQNNNNTLPTQSTLYQNYPNPFNPETVIEYYISEPASVGIKIFDASGKEVRSFNEGFKAIGKYSMTLNLIELPSGVYFYSLNTGEKKLSKKMVLIK
ncbi:MAG: T9SS type A sorting domain-containing protein [Ignavibacteria bacterium]|nr:T9SS type A sorting domain-containing protein [Ignavibacteria bacterium]